MQQNNPKEPLPEVQLSLFIETEPETQEEAPELPKERKPEEPPYVFYVPMDCR